MSPADSYQACAVDSAVKPLSTGPLPPVIDLKVEGKRFLGNDYIKTLDSNEQISFQFRPGQITS